MEALRHILSQLPRADPALPSGTQAELAWSLAAGPALAPRARCLGLRQGVLRVRAESSAVARQLAAVEPEIVLALREMLGAAQFQALEIL